MNEWDRPLLESEKTEEPAQQVYGYTQMSGKKRTGIHPAVWICCLLVGAMLFSGIGAAAGYVFALQTGGYMTQSGRIGTGNNTSLLTEPASTASSAVPSVTGEVLSAQEIYKIACSQTVGIQIPVTTTNVFGQTSSSAVTGTGFIITGDGYILTNYHVVQYADQYDCEIHVMLHDRTSYTAELVGSDPENDIAVVKIAAEGLSAAVLADSDQMQVGQTVYAVGNPLGELDYTMTDGIVSALGRVIQTDSSSAIKMFQMNAAINSGNSGGPVYDNTGRVIGVATAKYSKSGVEGLGFAVPINDAAAIANDIMTKGYVSGKAYLGISGQSLDARYAQHYSMPQGVYITSVENGSCAEKAGLQAGDVITAVNQTAVTTTTALKAALQQYAAGDTVELTVYRAGTASAVSVTLDEYVPEGKAD